MVLYWYTITVLSGQEFQAVFLSTTEPIAEDGNTLNPTKSPCDRYVFNTVLTRAKSLVVVVGSPRVLLNTEKHMVKLYGHKGRCWSLYLKSCIEHGTLIIPSVVEADKKATKNFMAELAAEVGATLPSDPRRSSRANYKTKGTISNTVLSEQVTYGSKEGMTLCSSQSTASQHSATQTKSKIRLVDRALSSGENIFKQMSQVANTNMQVTSSRHSQSAIHMQCSMRSVQKLKSVTNPAVNTVDQPLSSNLATIQSVQKNRVSASSSEQTINTTPSRPINSTSSPPLSKPMHRWNIEAQKSKSRGI